MHYRLLSFLVGLSIIFTGCASKPQEKIVYKYIKPKCYIPKEPKLEPFSFIQIGNYYCAEPSEIKKILIDFYKLDSYKQKLLKILENVCDIEEKRR